MGHRRSQIALNENLPATNRKRKRRWRGRFPAEPHPQGYPPGRRRRVAAAGVHPAGGSRGARPIALKSRGEPGGVEVVASKVFSVVALSLKIREWPRARTRPQSHSSSYPSCKDEAAGVPNPVGTPAAARHSRLPPIQESGKTQGCSSLSWALVQPPGLHLPPEGPQTNPEAGTPRSAALKTALGPRLPPRVWQKWQRWIACAEEFRAAEARPRCPSLPRRFANFPGTSQHFSPEPL